VTERLPIDVKLWALVSGVLLLLLIAADAANLFDDGPGSLGINLRLYRAGLIRGSSLLEAAALRVFVLAVVAAFVGWAVHAVAFACGLRLTRDLFDPPRRDYLELDEAEVAPAAPWDERLAHMVALKQRGELVDRGRQGRDKRIE
jgi:hypothetical protein